VLGDLGIALLVALMNFGRKYGRIFPEYDTLATMLRKNLETIVEAMKRLITHGFNCKIESRFPAPIGVMKKP